MSTIKVEEIQHISNSNNAVSIASDSSVSLKHSGSAKLATTSTGVTITGACAATSFSGDGSAITGITATDATKMPLAGGTFSGQVIFGSGLDLANLLKEGVNITASRLSANTNIDLENGMVHLFTLAENTTSTPNIRVSSSTTLDSSMSVGEAITVTIITTAAAAGYSAQVTIDGSAVTEHWVGGSAPSAGGSSGFDIYSYLIIKRASADFDVIANFSKTS